MYWDWLNQIAWIKKKKKVKKNFLESVITFKSIKLFLFQWCGYILLLICLNVCQVYITQDEDVLVVWRYVFKFFLFLYVADALAVINVLGR